MLKITQKEIEKSLKKLGLKKGDTILVHSDVSGVGLITDSRGRSDYLNSMYSAFKNVLGKSGTLAVPAFFYDYARKGESYDAKLSPVSKELGAFSRHIAGMKDAIRSYNPITALAAVGPKAEYICRGGTGSAYGVDSPWHRLHSLDAKMVFIGVDLRAMTFVHYVEHMVGVPHLYNKIFSTPIFDNGRRVNLPVCSQVRYRNLGVEYGSENLNAKFARVGLLKTVKLGASQAMLVSAKKAFNFMRDELKKDFSYFLVNPPEFIPRRIPSDGYYKNNKTKK